MIHMIGKDMRGNWSATTYFKLPEPKATGENFVQVRTHKIFNGMLKAEAVEVRYYDGVCVTNHSTAWSQSCGYSDAKRVTEKAVREHHLQAVKMVQTVRPELILENA